MITFSRFGQHGNLGNQLFQYATLLAFQDKYGCELQLPRWKWESAFKVPPPCVPHPRTADLNIEEPYFHYTPEFWDQYKTLYTNIIVNITGWLQSEKYFESCSELVRERLAFTDVLSNAVSASNEIALSRPTIAISVRRGDYVDNPNYELLPVEYYLGALLREFPDFEGYNIIFFSDDLDWCRLHFGCLANAFFPEGNPIEQLCLMSKCDHFIIANSTFSWWGAWLGEKEHSVVIRPAHLFAGPLLASSDWKDHYPERWAVYDHKTSKIDLQDVTFTIPVAYDHPNRKQNLNLSVCMLQRTFDTNIHIGEQGVTPRLTHQSQWCQYRHFVGMRTFHRTHMLNQMARRATTAIVVNWDADVFVPPAQIVVAVRALREGKADVVYPYDGRFARVPRAAWITRLERYLDLGIFARTAFPGTGRVDEESVGGAIIFRKESFIAGGMENEHFVTYGPEDRERWDRFNKLGFTVVRIAGALFHMDHWRGPDSTTRNPHYAANALEYEKIRSMAPEDLRKYVSTWPWLK